VAELESRYDRIETGAKDPSLADASDRDANGRGPLRQAGPHRRRRSEDAWPSPAGGIVLAPAPIECAG
jgi:hypothetical protein